MRFFSNFNTKAKSECIEENLQQYWQWNVLCLSKSKLYWFVKFFLPFLLYLVLVLGLILLFYYVFDFSYLGWIIFVVLILSFPFFISLIGKYIDYKMDFVVVTPESLIEYNQSWIFSKRLVVINEKSIKSITVQRGWFLYSIFNNGDLIFFSEWDETHWDITLRYVSQPEENRSKIAIIMNKD